MKYLFSEAKYGRISRRHFERRAMAGWHSCSLFCSLCVYSTHRTKELAMEKNHSGETSTAMSQPMVRSLQTEKKTHTQSHRHTHQLNIVKSQDERSVFTSSVSFCSYWEYFFQFRTKATTTATRREKESLKRHLSCDRSLTCKIGFMMLLSSFIFVNTCGPKQVSHCHLFIRLFFHCSNCMQAVRTGTSFPPDIFFNQQQFRFHFHSIMLSTMWSFSCRDCWSRFVKIYQWRWIIHWFSEMN